jgi:anti-sigma B factor antagonist
MRATRHLRLRRTRAALTGTAATHGWVEHDGPDRCVVSLRGEWDASNCDRLRELMSGVTGWYHVLVLDLTQVTFADSTVLALAVATQAAQRAAGGELRVVTTSAEIDALLDATGLRQALDVHGSRSDALRQHAAV